MSSHHFVKEDQEPAVLIAEPVNQEILFQLLEWSPKVVVIQEAVELAISLGVKIDVVICQSEAYQEFLTILSFQMPVQFILIDDYKSNGVQRGLSFLIAQNCKAVHVLGEIQDEEMEELAKMSLLDIVIWNNDYKWTCCRSGQFRKWMAKGSSFVIAIEKHVKIQSDAKVSQNERQGQMVIELLSDGMVKFQSDRLFWLGENINRI